MKVIGIIGSRRKNSPEDFKRCLTKFLEIYRRGDFIISGGCPQGGDRFAEIIAKHLDIPIRIHYADWKKYGKSAGFQRNGYIADDADVILAVVSDDRTGGTEDTIRKGIKGGKEIITV